MKNICLSIVAVVMTISSLQAQNDTLYLMRSGSVIGKFNIMDIDSAIFYKPACGSNIQYSALYNKWEVQSGMPSTKFINIKSDNSFSIFFEDATWGFRNVMNTKSMVSESQLFLYNTSSSGYYNYKISDSLLLLSNIYDNIVTKRNDNAPDYAHWVNYISSLDSVSAPKQSGDPREDIGFDGQNILYTNDANSLKLYKINVNTKAVSSLTLKYNAYYGSASYANNSIWFLEGNSVCKIDANGSRSFVSVANIERMDGGGSAFDGTNFYCSSRTALYYYNIASNTWSSLYTIPNITGMEYVDGYLYVIRGDAIHKCTTNPFKVEKTYIVKSASPNGYGALFGGITYDGNYFWVTLHNQYTNKNEIHKLNLD